jgi:Tfp pilus assembly protein PilP
MRMHGLLVIALLSAGAIACGEDDTPPPPPPPRPPGAPAPGKGAPAKAKGKGQALQPRQQIEARVQCPPQPIEKPTGKACKIDFECDAGTYCVPAGDKNATHCEPCPERERIRHEFRDRDFVLDQVRDPFQSFVISQPGLIEETSRKIEGPCNRADQFIAGNYSYLDLRLVGIVSQGTQRKVLMMDRGNLGHIIRRGDCVGKEKAVVKDIGTGYVTFVIAPDPEDKNPTKVPEERSVPLHPKGLQVAPLATSTEQAAPSAPIVAPPGESAAPAAPGSEPVSPSP